MLTARSFEFIRVIGTGAFGKVFLARHVDSGRYYAIKQMDRCLLKTNRQLDNIRNESRLLQELSNCPCIVKILQTFETSKYILIVMEYVRGGELFYYIRKYTMFNDYTARFFAAEILVALRHMHARHIIYRDLKPENILISDTGHVKLADFGFATRERENVYTMCGTPEYMAPEKLQGSGDTRATDYWSYGCLIYEMLCGKPPFYAAAPGLIYQRVLTEDLQFPPGIPPVARDLLRRLLAKEQSQRLGFRGIEEIFQHPFFADIDWARVENEETLPPIVPVPHHFEPPGSAVPSALRHRHEPPTHTYKRVFLKVDLKRWRAQLVGSIG